MIRLGPNIHPVMPTGKKDNPIRQYSAQEKEDLDQFLFQSNPDAILVMNSFDWAQRYEAMLPTTLITFRLYNKDIEGELWKHLSPAQYFEGMKAYMHPRIILNVGNEPNGKLPVAELHDMVVWYADVMELFGNAGIQIAGPAWGTGNPLLEYFTDDTSWLTMRIFFDALQAYHSLHYLNLHSYFNRAGLQIGNGHIGRHEQIADLLVQRDMLVSNMLITEYGADAHSGLPGHWKVAFGETDEGEDEYGDLLVGGQRQAFNQPYVKGLMPYCWGAYATWENCDISKAKRVQAKMIESNNRPLSPEEIPTQPETPPVVVVPPPAQPPPPTEEEPEAEPTWMDGLTAGERARIEMGRLLAKYGAAMRALVVDDDAYVLIAKLAAMLDTKS